MTNLVIAIANAVIPILIFFALASVRAWLKHLTEGLKNMSTPIQDLQAAAAAQKDLLVTQGALLARAIAKLDELAAAVAGSSDPAIAQLAADITASNDAIRAESTSVSDELDKLNPPTPVPAT